MRDQAHAESSRSPMDAFRVDVRHRVAFITLLAIILWAPFPLASARPLAAGVLVVTLAGLLFVVSLGDALAGRAPWRRIVRGWPLPAAIAAMAILIVVQKIDLGRGPISADPHLSLYYLLLTAGYMCAALLVLLLVTSHQRMRFLAYAIVVSGLVQALVGILLYAARAKYSMFYFEMDHALHAKGMFSYRNSLANYLLMSLFIGLGLLLSHTDHVRDRMNGWRSQLAKAGRFIFSGAMRLRLMLLVMVIALVLTRSRMGNAAFVITVLAVALPVLYATGRLKKAALILIASVLVIDIVIVGNLVGVERVMDRIQQTPIIAQEGFSQESMETRALPGNRSLAMIAERPWLGFGAGAFYAGFARFAAPEHTLYYDFAHNDFAQLAAETGLVGFALLGLAVLWAFRRALDTVRRPASTLDWGLGFGLILSMAAVLIQAAVDFHFHIPANALTFVILLAMAGALQQRDRISDNSVHTKVVKGIEIESSAG